MIENDIKASEKAILKDGATWGKSNNWIWNGIRCHWRVLGEENHKPIVLIHGFGASSAHWRHNAGVFAAAGFCVYGIDLIGFGESEQPSPKVVGRLDNQFWSQQISAFLEDIVQTSQHGKAVLIGNSLGGLTALTALVLNPELVAAVVAAPLPDPALMQPMQLSESEISRKIRTFFTKIFFHLLPLELLLPLISRTILIRVALQAAYSRCVRRDKELERLVTKPAQKHTAAKTLRSMCIGMSTRSKAITAPVLLENLNKRKNRRPILMLWGRDDKLVPIKIGKQLLRKYSWLSLYVLEKSGHCPHDELPHEFNKNVLEWLERNLAVEVKQT